MQTDRQDLDKRYINLLCVEPKAVFPLCNGSLKLTEYGYSVEYTSETSCADVKKTCKEIVKSISKRPEVGDVGGRPDIPIPDITEQNSLSERFRFGETSQLDDGRLVVFHYNSSGWMIGELYLSILDVSGGGVPSILSKTLVEFPDSQSAMGDNAIDIITFNSDTFVLAFTNTNSPNYRYSLLLKGSIALDDSVSFDSVLTNLYDVKPQIETMYNATFTKFDNNSGFALFYNVERYDVTDSCTRQATSKWYTIFLYDGNNFTQVRKVMIPYYPFPRDYTKSSSYNPPYNCDHQVCFFGDMQIVDFEIGGLLETANSYVFYGMYHYRALTNAYWISYFLDLCANVPIKAIQEVLIPVKYLVSKSTYEIIEVAWNPKRICSGAFPYIKCKMLSDNRALIIYRPIGQTKQIVLACKVSSSGSFYVYRSFSIPSVSPDNASHIYPLNSEHFIISVSDTFAKIYSCVWKEDDSFCGRLGDDYDIILGYARATFLTGQTITDGRICLINTQQPQRGDLHMLEVNYV